MDRTGPRVHVAPTRCPFCHEAVQKGEQPAVCPECHALHHVACLDEAGACAACGRRVASPEDSKLAAALRSPASARVTAPVTTPSPAADKGWRRAVAILLETGVLVLVVGVLAQFIGAREAMIGGLGLILVLTLLAPRRPSSGEG